MILKKKYTLNESLRIDEFFYIANKCQLALYKQHNIFETYHVADGLEEITDYIAELVKSIINENGTSSSHIYDNFERFYTGYNFDWMYYKSLKNISNSKSLHEPVCQLNDERQPYPIYLELFYDEGEIFIDSETEEQKHIVTTGNAYYRDIADETAQKIIIRINAFRYKNINGASTYLLLKSTIAHELQHVFDMYILPSQNRIETNKRGGLTIDFSDNIFDIQNHKDFVCLKHIVNMMSFEERNARLAELKTFISGIVENPSLCDEIFYNKIKNKMMIPIIKTMDSHSETLTDKALFNKIAYNQFIQSITRVNFYRDCIEEIIRYNGSDYKIFKTYMLIIGYYMFKHNMLDLLLTSEQKSIVKKLFSDIDEVKRVINQDELSDDYKWIVDFVYNNIKNVFSEYVCYVNGTLMQYVNQFCSYKFLKEVYGTEEIRKLMIPENSIMIFPIND